jgi:hypothetical protein
MVRVVQVSGIAEEWLKTQEVIQDHRLRRGDFDDYYGTEIKVKLKKRNKKVNEYLRFN